MGHTAPLTIYYLLLQTSRRDLESVAGEMNIRICFHGRVLGRREPQNQWESRVGTHSNETISMRHGCTTVGNPVVCMIMMLPNNHRAREMLCPVRGHLDPRIPAVVKYHDISARELLHALDWAHIVPFSRSRQCSGSTICSGCLFSWDNHAMTLRRSNDVRDTQRPLRFSTSCHDTRRVLRGDATSEYALMDGCGSRDRTPPSLG